MAIPRKPAPKTPVPVVAPAPQPAPQNLASPPAPAAPVSADAVLTKMRDNQEGIRKAAEESIERSRAAYEKIKDVAEAATGSLETSFSAMRSGLQSLNAKSFEAVKSHTQAGFDHAQSLLAARDFKDLITLQTEFARRQFDILTAQTKEFATHCEKIFVESVAPIKAAVTPR